MGDEEENDEECIEILITKHFPNALSTKEWTEQNKVLREEDIDFDLIE